VKNLTNLRKKSQKGTAAAALFRLFFVNMQMENLFIEKIYELFADN